MLVDAPLAAFAAPFFSSLAPAVHWFGSTLAMFLVVMACGRVVLAAIAPILQDDAANVGILTAWNIAFVVIVVLVAWRQRFGWRHKVRHLGIRLKRGEVCIPFDCIFLFCPKV